MNKSGTKTVRISAAPSTFDDGHGRKPRGKGLEAKGGKFSVSGGAVPVDIAGRSGADDLVSVGSTGRRLVVGRPNSSGVDSRPGKGRVKGVGRGVRPDEFADLGDDATGKVKKDRDDAVAFDGVFGPGTELSYEVSGSGVKESIVLSSAPVTAPVLRFPVSAAGLTWRGAKGGGFEVVDPKTSSVLFIVPPAFAYDSRGGEATPGNGHVAVQMEMVADDAGSVLVLRPSSEWLRSPQRVCPVTVDPSIAYGGYWFGMNIGSMPWGDNSGGTSFGAITDRLLFGNWYGSEWRSYFRVDPGVFANKSIVHAWLSVRIDQCANQFNPAQSYYNSVHVRKLTSGFVQGQSWQDKPTVTGDATGVISGPLQYMTVYVRDWAREWAANPATAFGFQLDMGADSIYCRVNTFWNPWTAFMTVEYDDAPPPGVTEYGTLRDFSFENGTPGAWTGCDRAEAVSVGRVQNATRAAHGQYFGYLSAADRNGTVSMCQTVPYRTGQGLTYVLTARVRSSAYGQQARLILWESGMATQGAFFDFPVNPDWGTVRVQMNGAASSNLALRAEIVALVPSTGNAQLDVDSVDLQVTGTKISLTVGQSLANNSFIESSDGRYRAVMQSDGNFVVYDKGPAQNQYIPMWSTQTSGAGSQLAMQYDGNLVLYAASGTPLWWTSTGYGPTSSLWMQTDSNLVLYKYQNYTSYAIWSRLSGLIAPPQIVITVDPQIPNIPTGGADADWVGDRIQVGNVWSQRCLDVPVTDTAVGASVGVADCVGSASRWEAIGGNGIYMLLHKQSGYCAKVETELGGRNGSRVRLDPCTGDDAAQRFYLNRTAGGWQVQTFSGVAAPGGVVGCLDEAVSGSFLVQHWDCTGRDNQYWFPVKSGVVLPTPPLEDFERVQLFSEAGYCLGLVDDCVDVLPRAVSVPDAATGAMVSGFMLHPDDATGLCVGPSVVAVACAPATAGSGVVFVPTPAGSAGRFLLRVGSNQSQCLAISPSAVTVQVCNQFAFAQLFATRATSTTVMKPDPCDGDLDIDSDCGDDANAAATTRAYPTTTGGSIVMRVQRFLNPACTGTTSYPCVAQGSSASERKEYTAQAHFIRAIRDVPSPTGTVDWEVSLPSGTVGSKKRVDVAFVPSTGNQIDLYEVKKEDKRTAAIQQLRDYVDLFTGDQINAVRGQALSAQLWARRYPDYRGTPGGVWVVWRDPQAGIVLFETVEKVGKWPSSRAALQSSLLNAPQLTYPSLSPPSSTTTVFLPGTTATPSRKRK